MGIKEMFRALFATGADIEDDSDVEFTAEQRKALDKRKEAEAKVEYPISEQSKDKKGLRKRYEAPNIKVMDGKSKANLEKMTDILKGEKVAEKEIGE